MVRVVIAELAAHEVSVQRLAFSVQRLAFGVRRRMASTNIEFSLRDSPCPAEKFLHPTFHTPRYSYAPNADDADAERRTPNAP